MADNAEIAPQQIGEGKPLKEYVEAFERMLIDNTMRRHRGSFPMSWTNCACRAGR
jgi:DNA-binding NtrC family response regulator